MVLFHFTTRFTEIYRPGQTLSVAFPHGHLGVNLFFIISGFVIFITLERTVQPMGFVVSRFSRLFPSYWAAIVLTFMVTHWLGLPGKMVDLGSALANGLQGVKLKFGGLVWQRTRTVGSEYRQASPQLGY